MIDLTQPTPVGSTFTGIVPNYGPVQAAAIDIEAVAATYPPHRVDDLILYLDVNYPIQSRDSRTFDYPDFPWANLLLVAAHLVRKHGIR